MNKKWVERLVSGTVIFMIAVAILGVSQTVVAQGPEDIPGLIFPPYGDQPYVVRKLTATNKGSLNSWGVHGNRNNDWLGTDFVSTGDKVLYAPISGVAGQGHDPDGGHWVSVVGRGEWDGWFARYIHMEDRGRPKAGTRVNSGDPVGFDGHHLHAILLKCSSTEHRLVGCKTVPILSMIPKGSWPESWYDGNHTESYSPPDDQLWIPPGAVAPSWDEEWQSSDKGQGRPAKPPSAPSLMQIWLVEVFWRKAWQLVEEKNIPVPVALRQKLEEQLNPTLQEWGRKLLLGLVFLVAFVATGLFLVIYLLVRHGRMRRELEQGIRRDWRPVKVGWRKTFFWLMAAMLLARKVFPGNALTQWWWTQLALIAGAVWLAFKVESWILGPTSHFLGGKSKRNLQRFLEGWLFQILAWGALVPWVLVHLLFVTGWFFYIAPVEATGIGFAEFLKGTPVSEPAGDGWKENRRRPGPPSLWNSKDAPILPPVQLTWWNGQRFTLNPPRKIWEDLWLVGKETGTSPTYNLCLGSSESQVFWTVTACSGVGACGPYQFMAGTWPTYQPWPGASRFGWPDAPYGEGKMAKALKLDVQPTKAAHERRFRGLDGGLMWNNHKGQADYVWDCTQTVEAAIAAANR